MKKGINAIIIVGTILSTIGIVFGLKVKFFDNTINAYVTKNSTSYSGNKNINIKKNSTGKINIKLNINSNGIYLIEFGLPEQVEIYEDSNLTKRIYHIYKIYNEKTKENIIVYYKNNGNDINQAIDLNIKRNDLQGTMLNKASENDLFWQDKANIEEVEFAYEENPVCNECYNLSSSVTKVYAKLEENKLKIVSDYMIYLPEDSSYMFDNFENLKSIKFANINTKYVKNMAYMFSNNKKLEKIDLSTFDTSNVNNMEGLFRNDENLKQIDISNLEINPIEENLKCNYIFKNIDSESIVYVRTPQEQAWVFGLNIYIRPGTWTKDNIKIKQNTK